VAEGSNADIDTSEEDIVAVTDPNLLTQTQFTIYIDYDLGTHTSLELKFYYRGEVDGEWYELPQKNLSDDTIDESPWIIDASSPADRFNIEFHVGAAYAFKITGIGVGGANGSVTAKIVTRNN
jgi:hypothetical protein